MRSLWMGVVPGPQITRILVQDGPSQTVLKARLPNLPRHPGALPTLCEAVALWCGSPERAAVAVGGLQISCGLTPWLDAIDHVIHSPLCEIELVHHPPVVGVQRRGSRVSHKIKPIPGIHSQNSLLPGYRVYHRFFDLHNNLSCSSIF